MCAKEGSKKLGGDSLTGNRAKGHETTGSKKVPHQMEGAARGTKASLIRRKSKVNKKRKKLSQETKCKGNTHAATKKVPHRAEAGQKTVRKGAWFSNFYVDTPANQVVIVGREERRNAGARMRKGTGKTNRSNSG